MSSLGNFPFGQPLVLKRSQEDRSPKKGTDFKKENLHIALFDGERDGNLK
jgi:hypothetical protein